MVLLTDPTGDDFGRYGYITFVDSVATDVNGGRLAGNPYRCVNFFGAAGITQRLDMKR